MSKLYKFTTRILTEFYNTQASLQGKPTVKRFSDRKSLIRRLKVDLGITEQDFLDAQPKEDVPAPTPEKQRSAGAKFFQFPAGSKPTLPKQTGSLRAQAIELLKEGAQFAQVEQLVQEFDKSRGKTPFNVERRAYELVRLIHYTNGFGVKQNAEGIITLFN